MSARSPRLFFEQPKPIPLRSRKAGLLFCFFILSSLVFPHIPARRHLEAVFHPFPVSLPVRTPKNAPQSLLDPDFRILESYLPSLKTPQIAIAPRRGGYKAFLALSDTFIA